MERIKGPPINTNGHELAESGAKNRGHLKTANTRLAGPTWCAQRMRLKGVPVAAELELRRMSPKFNPKALKNWRPAGRIPAVLSQSAMKA